MKNIWKIINTDAHRIFSSVVALVVLMGLCVVPCLYSWFNIFSNWDPYGVSATSRIRVAVATEDRGADIFGLRLDVGEQLMEGLKANDQLGWVFCESTDEALKLVYSGDCYAAIIVPQSFSEDIVSFLSMDFEHPQLLYYENGKKNAIAPKITGKAKTAVQETVNTTFLQTFTDAAASIVSALSANGVDAETALHDLSDKLVDLSMKLENADAMLDSLISLANSASTLMVASSNLAASMGTTVYLTSNISEDIGTNLIEAADTAKDTVNTIGAAFEIANTNVTEFLNEMNRVTSSEESFKNYLSGPVVQTEQSLADMQNSAAAIAARTQGIPGLELFSQGMQGLSDDLGSLNQQLKEAADSYDMSRLDGIRTTLNNMSGNLGTLSQEIGNAANSLGQRINEALDKIQQTAGNTTQLLRVFGEGMMRISSQLMSLATAMVNTQERITEAKQNLNNARQQMLELADFLDALAGSQFLKEVIEVLSSGDDALNSHIASPLRVSNEVIYPAEPYGAQMSPFYTVLALYVGALFCACLLKTDIRQADRPKRLRMPQHYLGRYALFLSCGLLQAVITAAGVLLYVGVKCQHPWYFFWASLATSFCFVTLNYVLAFTLGSAGLGASVIIMVVQVAGSGGTYPVEVLPKIFQILYPYMPFKFGMNAMREALSGFYGSYYLDNIRMLFLIALGSLVVGVIIYFPAKLLNNALEKSKQATGVMI